MKYKTLAFTISLILSSPVANANPTGGQVVHGTATFSNPSVNVLNVTNSNNAIINWQSFNIGAGQTTNFIQPSSASSVLNRVISNNPSQLLGNLNSNGKVFLINQHGILVGAGAQINTAGFFGSTLNITDGDYLNGNLKFEGGGNGGISNQGYIHAGDNGNIVLIAPNIENGGVIEVDNGNIILAAGKSITISSLENPAIQFEVTGSDNTVTNLGKILANQGSASLFAGTLNHSGSIRADGLVQNADGTISLVAKNTNHVSGSVDASGTQGGYIEILGDTVNIDEGANINASGDAAGGEILIGGDQQGLNPDIQNATSTTIAASARVNADANTTGNGGKVIVFAKEDVHVHGEVTARGGAVSGDGGFIETSGLLSLDITSVPDASAVNGVGGEWLIDPNDITISLTADALITASPDFTSTGDNAFLSVTSIQDALMAGTNVIISTGTAGTNLEAGDINILSNILVTLPNNVSLTLNAHNDINFDTFTAGGDINIAAAGSGALDLILNPNTGTGDPLPNSGQVNINVTGNVAVFDVNLNLNGGSLTVNGDTSITGSGSVNLINTNWDVLQGHSVNMQFAALDLDATSVLTNDGDINMDNAIITGVGQFYNKGDIRLNAVSTSSSVIDTANLSFVNDGWFSIEGFSDLTLTGGILDLKPGAGLSGSGTLNSDVTVNGGVIIAGDGTTSYDTLSINGKLTINSGAVYSIISEIEGPLTSRITVNTVTDGLTINGGDLILNWESSSDPTLATTGDLFSVVDCFSTGCLNTTASGFDRVINPITTTGGVVNYGVSFVDAVTYEIGTLDTTNIVNWTGLSTLNPTDWNDSANWDTGVPGTSSDVFIADGNGPAIIDITSLATVRGLQSHAQIKVGAGGSLDIAGNAFILNPTSVDGGLAISASDATVSRSGTGVLYNLGATLKLDQGTLSAETVNWGEIQTSVGTPFQIDGNLVNNALFALDANTGTNTFTGAGSIDNKGIMSWANGADLTLMDSVTLSSSSSNAQFQGAGLLTLNNNATFAINSAPAVYSNTINWTLNSGSIMGVDNLTSLPDLVDWYGGTISASSLSSVLLGSSQVMNLYGTSDMILAGGLGLDSSGTINFLSSVGNLVIDGELVNRGTLNINHTNSALGFTGTGFLTNEGDINQISANDFILATATNNSFTQNGNLNISNGKFILQTPSDFNSGILNIDSGAYFTVDSGGKVVLSSSFQGITGAGIIEVVNGGIFDLNSLTSNTHGKDLSSLAALNINAGQVNNIQDTILPAIVNLSGGGVIQGADILGLGLSFGLDIPSTTTINVNGGSFSGFDSVSSTPVNFLSVNNSGTINVVSGQSLSLLNTELTIAAATPAPTPSGVLTGAGQVEVGFGSNLIADGTVDISRIALSGGTLTANSFAYAGDILWTMGTVNGSGSGLTTSGQVDLFTGVLNTDWTITSTGTVNWSSPDYASLDINNATITNQGVFNISSYVDITSQTLGGKNFSTSTAAIFINEGLLIIDSDAFPGVQGSDVIVFDLAFDNVGGTIAIKSGTFRIESGGVVQDLQLDAGESLQGFGTFEGNVINVAGTVSPGKSDLAAGVFQTGTLTISGDFIQQVDGNLIIKMDSTASGLVHDRLVVDGTLNAGGNVRFAVINGKTDLQIAALINQSFTPLTYGSFANRFDSVTIPPGLNFDFSNTGEITITSSSEDLNKISNILETLFDSEELNHPQMVKAMRFFDRVESIVTSDEEDDEKKKAPRLVCR